MSTGPTGVNSPDRRLTDNGYFCNQYGYIAYDDYGVQYSYGKSPYAINSGGAFYVYPGGVVDYNIDDGVYGSYGKRSPDPARDDNAWRVLPSGGVFGSNYYDVADSYGHLTR